MALALAEHGMLARYVTGVPAHLQAISVWLRPFLKQHLAAHAIDIEPQLVKHVFVAPIVRRLASRFASYAIAVDWSHRGEAWFDWLAAREVAALKPDIVVCYENAALATFQTAKKLGIRTVLDAASFHYAWQDRFYDPVESRRAHRRIVQRKEAEIKLADRVLTVSELARESYLEAGVEDKRTKAVPMGVDLSRFVPKQDARQNGPVRFVFVGQIGPRKGADVIRAAIERVHAQQTSFQLTLIGNYEMSPYFDQVKHCRHIGWLSHAALAAELPKHDVLILPSRHDSFGMVVAEAMACGLPAIVTENVGAKEMVTPELNGTIVPAGDAISLADAMGWFIDHLDRLPEMAAAARASAERYSWNEYRSRVVATLCEVCHRRESPPIAMTISHHP
jgi:glycosyltransferase involved in cell wall biosynthesis